jgi:hypothetical protein
VTGLDGQSGELERLVGRDPTGDAKKDSRQRAGAAASRGSGT